jgi:hypothetical protein
MRSIPHWTLSALLLAGCAGGRVETRRTIPVEPATVAERLVAELTRLGFRRISRGKGLIEAMAGSVAPSWATCGPILVGDGDDRHRMVSAGQEHGSVRIMLAPATGGTSLAVLARFVADYRNPYTTNSLERACRTTGVLERMLLDEAAR